MIKIENVVLPYEDQWRAVIRGMRNPKNSWHLSDSFTCNGNCPSCNLYSGDNSDGGCICCEDLWPGDFVIGENDHKLMSSLAKGGPVHAKYRRMIPVYLDITAPLYWWKEADKYQVGVVTNSCSTMHKIDAKEFELDDFSYEHLTPMALADLKRTINLLNIYRNTYLYGGEDLLEDGGKVEYEPKDRYIWWQLIQLLPSSYNQRRTVYLSYEVLYNIYHSRKHHKLDEWREFCQWIETLPYSELITLATDETQDNKE